MPIPAEAQEKERRVYEMLARLGYDALVITQRANFAWLTCGGRAVVGYAGPGSPVYLVLAGGARYAVGYSIDLPRTYDDELQGLGYEPVSLPSFGKTPAETALALAGARVAADAPLPGAADAGAAVLALHEPYTPEEMARYAAVAQESGALLAELAAWVAPGMTERQAAAHMWELYVAHGFEGRYMFLGSDERIRRYRHAAPSDKPIERAVLLAPCGAKYGLHVPNSRLVYFGDVPADIRLRYEAVAGMQAAVVAALRPGACLAAIRQQVLDGFVAAGYPEERWVHFHGGPVGYAGSYWQRTLDPAETIRANTAFAWYLTVAGAKSEELVLVDDGGAHIESVDPAWPRLSFTCDGTTVEVPDILVRRS